MLSFTIMPPARRDPSSAVIRETATDALHAAVVHAAGRICFLTAAPSRSLLAEHLAAYVCEQAPIQLRSFDAGRVAELVASGRNKEAVAHYFESVGEKWDEERLVVVQVPNEAPAGADRWASEQDRR